MTRVTIYVIEKIVRDTSCFFCHGLVNGRPILTEDIQQAHRYPTESGARSALEEFGLNDEKYVWEVRPKAYNRR